MQSQLRLLKLSGSWKMRCNLPQDWRSISAQPALPRMANRFALACETDRAPFDNFAIRVLPFISRLREFPAQIRPSAGLWELFRIGHKRHKKASPPIMKQWFSTERSTQFQCRPSDDAELCGVTVPPIDPKGVKIWPMS